MGLPQTPTSSSKDSGTSTPKEKKWSTSGASTGAGADIKPKTVTVSLPEKNKQYTTGKKNRPIQAELDVSKEFLKCRDDGCERLDLSKSSVSLSVSVRVGFSFT
jgi:leucine-rich repeat protein SHOC2